jgi:two-component system response regulator FixJ
LLELLALSRRFAAALPSSFAVPPRRTAPARPARKASSRRPGFPVYLVEPERASRAALVRDLTAAGYAARPFANPDELRKALADLPPGCVVMDIAAAGKVKAAPLPTILLYAALDELDAVAAVRFGAVDLLRRPVGLPDLLAALDRAAPKVREMEVREAARRARAAVETLTRREREVMECMMKGQSNKEIARILGLSPRTVEMHRARLHRRLSVTSLTELLAIAFRARDADSL